MQGPTYIFLVSTEMPVRNGSPRRENLPDTVRDLTSNVPAESASSAELRRSRDQLQSPKHMSQKAQFSVYRTVVLTEEHARFDFRLGTCFPEMPAKHCLRDNMLVALLGCCIRVSSGPAFCMLRWVYSSQPSRSQKALFSHVTRNRTRRDMSLALRAPVNRLNNPFYRFSGHESRLLTERPKSDLNIAHVLISTPKISGQFPQKAGLGMLETGYSPISFFFFFVRL